MTKSAISLKHHYCYYLCVKAKIEMDVFNKTELVSIVAGLSGSLMYIYRKNISLFEKFVIFVIGGTSSFFITPFLVHYFGWEDKMGAVGFIGYVVGAISMEAFQSLVALMDYIQNNPSIVIDIIRLRFKSKDNEIRVQERLKEDGQKDVIEEGNAKEDEIRKE